MTVYRVTMGSKEYTVDVSSQRMMVNGVLRNANLEEINSRGLYMLRRGAYKLEMFIADQGNSGYAILVGGRHIIAQVEKAAHGVRRHLAGNKGGDIVAPMPAQVIAIKVNEGDTVEQGQVILVLESMKMQMDFKAPVQGVVGKIHVKTGQSVNKGDLMVAIEEPNP